MLYTVGNMHSLTNKQGFTMLEMGIVLAIVGLLVGGVLAGASYLRNAERSTAMNEAKYYLDAFNKFQDLYGLPAGDMATAEDVWGAGTTDNGNGNGMIRRVTAGLENPVEIFLAFEHMGLASLLANRFSAAAGELPSASISNVEFFFDFPDTLNNYVPATHGQFYEGMYGHFLRMYARDPADALPDDPFLTAPEAFEVDNKMDDGRPGTGWIRTLEPVGLADCATTNVPATAAYNVGLAGQLCGFILLQQ